MDIKKLKIGSSLYASKKFRGNNILKYTKDQEKKYKNHCLIENLSWFGNLEVAKHYTTKNSKIYEWKLKKNTDLLTSSKKNEKFIINLFKKTKLKLIPSIQLKEKEISKIKNPHSYLNMSQNEKALFEFRFAFGYMNLKEQFDFLHFIKYLIHNKFIDIKRRDGKKSIIKKIRSKLIYYKQFSSVFTKKKYNRISFYHFDKYALMNLCKIIHKKKYNISGFYQKNNISFWFSNEINIEEYALFNPHKNLIYYDEI